MTALDMVVCDLTPFFYPSSTAEMLRGKGLEKIFTFIIKEKEGKTRDYGANNIRYLYHTHFPFHTHTHK